MTRKLDKTRSFCTIHGNDGEHAGKEAFMQDGAHFDSRGEEIGAAANVPQPQPKSAPAKPASQLDKQLAS